MEWITLRTSNQRISIIRLKSPISHDKLVTESNNKHMSFTSYRRIGITICVSELFRNFPTVVGIMCVGNGSNCGIYAWLIVIDLCIGTKFFCSGVGKIEYKARGGGND